MPSTWRCHITIAYRQTQLVEEQRTVLELFYRFGHSCEEIAEMVDCPANTVKSRMFHARRKMRRLLPRLAGFEIG